MSDSVFPNPPGALEPNPGAQEFPASADSAQTGSPASVLESLDPNPQWDIMNQNETDLSSVSLSRRQLLAIPLIASAPSTLQGARAAGIGRATLYRWLDDDNFRQELQRVRDAAAQIANEEIKGLSLQAASVIAKAMDDPNPSVRLRAARYALEFIFRITQSEQLRKELKVLQEALPLIADRQ